MSKQNYGTISGKPKLAFLCNSCGFTMRTSGPVYSAIDGEIVSLKCPRCGFDPIAEVKKEQEVTRELLAANFEEVRA